MNATVRGFALALMTAILAIAVPVDAARQVVALFPPVVLPASGEETLSAAVPVLEKALEAKLGERFDVRSIGTAVPTGTEDRTRRKARSIGASYTITGTLSRIGRGVTLDLTLAPVEDSGKGRTVVVSGILENAPPVSERNQAVFRQLGTDAAHRLNVLFFGPGNRGAVGGESVVPDLAGTIRQSAPLPGKVVSVAIADLDRDGKEEIAAAYDAGIEIYQLEGDDLREKAGIPEAGPGLFYMDAGDVDRDGIAEILTGRFVGRKAVSDIWKFDGKGYRRIASDLPYFLRTADLGPEGIVLIGQESDSRKIYRGPIYRMTLGPSGAVEISDREHPLPLPEGTFIHAFTPLRWMKGIRYAAISARDRLVYLDSAGKEIWEGLDSFTGTEIELGGINEKIRFPVRMVAVDLNRDGNDEVVILNVLESAGIFFENLRVATMAELVCFTQTRDFLQLAWRSPQTDTSARDLLLDRDRLGVLRFGMASRNPGKLLGGASQWRMYWLR